MCFQDGHKMDALSGKQRFPGRNAIQKEPHGNLPDQLSGRQILCQHDEIIPEVEKDLSFIAFWQGSTPQVIDHGSWAGIYFIPCQLYAPAEVDLFLVGEKIAVQAAQFMIKMGSHEEGGPTGPENGL